LLFPEPNLLPPPRTAMSMLPSPMLPYPRLP
jgi:hypothetical protein